MSRQKQDSKFRIRFDRVPTTSTKFLDIDRTYIEKGLVELNEEDNEAALTSLGELYGIELVSEELLDAGKLTDEGYDWVMVYFSQHKLNQEILAKVKA